MAVTPLATPDDAAAYGYALPADTATEWLARATIRVRRAAGQPIVSTESTVRLPVDAGTVDLPSPPITAVTSVAVVNADGTTTALDPITGWRWDGSTGLAVLAGCADQAEVVFTHGFLTIPDELIELVCSIAYRLSTTPVGMEAGIRSVTIDDYSRTFAAEARTDASVLLPGEQIALGSILGLPTVWVVGSR